MTVFSAHSTPTPIRGVKALCGHTGGRTINILGSNSAVILRVQPQLLLGVVDVGEKHQIPSCNRPREPIWQLVLPPHQPPAAGILKIGEDQVTGN